MDVGAGDTGAVDYESDRLTSEYLHFHYGTAAEVLPWSGFAAPALSYAERVVAGRFPARPAGRGLDVGCAVGRSAFEMARWCGEVVGVDYSAKFIEAAETLRSGAAIQYRMKLQGERESTFSARMPDGVDPDRIRFAVADAHALPEDLGSFDWVLGANLLCRLHHPRRFLDSLPRLVNSGGTLVLNSPFTWMREHTDPEEWIGARRGGRDSASELAELLEADFELLDVCDMPFLIRETERKYQLTFAHSARWRRR
ncbi:MAG: putative 4-mercaptohistidine N1-methyltransferase [Puniceicoccaceae bacterium]